MALHSLHHKLSSIPGFRPQDIYRVQHTYVII